MVGAAQKWQVGTLSGATNGASLNAFPGSLPPLSAMVLNLGLVQTRKSQITSAVQKVSDAIQARCRQRLMAREDAGQRAKLLSCTLTSFTEAAMWERCSSDWQQCPTGQVTGRLHFSTLMNLDEGYKFLKYLGLAASLKGDTLVRRKGGCKSFNHDCFHGGVLSIFVDFSECTWNADTLCKNHTSCFKQSIWIWA